MAREYDTCSCGFAKPVKSLQCRMCQIRVSTPTGFAPRAASHGTAFAEMSRICDRLEALRAETAKLNARLETLLSEAEPAPPPSAPSLMYPNGREAALRAKTPRAPRPALPTVSSLIEDALAGTGGAS